MGRKGEEEEDEFKKKRRYREKRDRLFVLFFLDCFTISRFLHRRRRGCCVFAPFLCCLKQTNKQVSKQTNSKQTNTNKQKQTNKQASKQANKSKQAN